MKAILQKVKGDKVIWSVVIVLIFISLLIVYSTCSSLAFKKDKHATAYLLKQLMFLGFGVYIIYLVHRINYTKFAKLSVALYIFSLPLLLYTFFFGQKLNGGSRWVHLPVINLSFQSSDFAKLALFVFLARLLSIKQGAIKDWKQGFLPLVIPVAATCALIAPANLSTALMLGATCCILFYIGRVKVKHIMALVGVGAVGFGLLFFISVAFGIGRGPTWKKRLTDFMGKHNTTATVAANGSKDDKAAAEDVFQVQQAKIAIANGGVSGRGPGHSIMRDTLPEAYSDFVYSSIIEEYGLFGGAVMIFLYLLFLWRSILLFRRCPYAFGAFLAVGLSITLVFQAMLNMGVNVHLLPVTGLTLPMVSMGGSSIWFTSIAIGIILSVSRYVDETEGRKAQEQLKEMETAAVAEAKEQEAAIQPEVTATRTKKLREALPA